MTESRITQHPILPIPHRNELEFFWQGQPLIALENEPISAALIAAGVRIFGHHPRDGAPQSLFCANGQCSQCMLLADAKPVKACIELVKPGMHVEPLSGLPVLPIVATVPPAHPILEIETSVLIIGGGPAGLSAAIELGKRGVAVILVDDKNRLGGKLVLQTHRFFGSSSAVFAGTRGIDIATRLENDLAAYPTIQVWLQSTALAVFSDKKVGVLRHADQYTLVMPQVVLVATGAREKFLAFKGNTLPGVFGAGAFQTLVNRDLVRPSEKLFIIGGGNVGLIAGYHALQAGIGVVGLAEALPEVGGYKVHKDKLVRMGVPIYTSHTILSANGSQQVESVTICQVDASFQPILGTERSYECDSILIAVGLDPVNEFYAKAIEFDVPVFSAGDAEEIAEASAAMFSGKIKGLEICRALNINVGEIPRNWYRTGEILKSKPGRLIPQDLPDSESGVVPILHCTQEIPCDPCSALCERGLIEVDPSDIRSIPRFIGDNYSCGVCERCVAGCPGLAITLVDYRANPHLPIVSIPYEFTREMIQKQDIVVVEDAEGIELSRLEVLSVHTIPTSDRTLLVEVQAPQEIARRIAGIRVQEQLITQPLEHYIQHIADDIIICRCERVTAGEIRALIHQGYRDMNELKIVTRAGMGACGAKTCNTLIHRLFREEGVPFNEISEYTRRPIFIEVPLSVFAGENQGDQA